MIVYLQKRQLCLSKIHYEALPSTMIELLRLEKS